MPAASHFIVSNEDAVGEGKQADKSDIGSQRSGKREENSRSRDVRLIVREKHFSRLVYRVITIRKT